MAVVDSGTRAERIAALGFDYAAESKVRVERCNLCGESVFVGLTHRDRYGYPAATSGCSRCGLVFLDPVMTARRLCGVLYANLPTAGECVSWPADRCPHDSAGAAGVCGGARRPAGAVHRRSRLPHACSISVVRRASSRTRSRVDSICAPP